MMKPSCVLYQVYYHLPNIAQLASRDFSSLEEAAAFYERVAGTGIEVILRDQREPGEEHGSH